jgi:hypothetical protein
MPKIKNKIKYLGLKIGLQIYNEIKPFPMDF